MRILWKKKKLNVSFLVQCIEVIIQLRSQVLHNFNYTLSENERNIENENEKRKMWMVITSIVLDILSQRNNSKKYQKNKKKTVFRLLILIFENKLFTSVYRHTEETEFPYAGREQAV